jgi:hypothetical protein
MCADPADVMVYIEKRQCACWVAEPAGFPETRPICGILNVMNTAEAKSPAARQTLTELALIAGAMGLPPPFEAMGTGSR